MWKWEMAQEWKNYSKKNTVSYSDDDYTTGRLDTKTQSTCVLFD